MPQGVRQPSSDMIRNATLNDVGAICAIYNPYVVESTISFEEQMVSSETMSARIMEVATALPWLVVELDAGVIGYAYATPWRVRPAYRYSVETTVYVAPQFHGRGIGRMLYVELIARLQALGIHRAMGVIALPNPGSVKLHEKLGFKKVGHFEEVGRKFQMPQGYVALVADESSVKCARNALS
jgi:L-amino acid N-acyltransferase YncA